MRLKAKEIYGHVKQLEKHQILLASAGCLACFKKWNGMKNVKFSGSRGTVRHEMILFLIFAECFTGKRIKWKSKFKKILIV